MTGIMQVGLDGGSNMPFLACHVAWLMVRMKPGTVCVCVFIKPSPTYAIDRWPIRNDRGGMEVHFLSWKRKCQTILAMLTLPT